MRFLATVRANPDLVRLELVWALTSLVRWALSILVALYAYREAGVPAVGLAALVRMAPAALLAPRLSLVVDRHSRRTVLLVSLLCRVLLAGGLAAVAVLDGSLAALLVLAAAFGVAASLQQPVQAALLGVHARNPAELAAANTLWSILDNVGFVVGSLLVGGLVAVTSIAHGFMVCLVPLLLAGAVARRLTRDDPHPPVEDTDGRLPVLAGLHTVVGDARLRLLVGVLAVDLFVQAMVDVLLVVFALGSLDMGQEGAGWLSAAWGVGGIVGGAVAAALLTRGRLAGALSVGMLLGGLPFVAVGLWPDQALALLAMVGLGVGFGLIEVGLLTLTQRLVSADVLGRVYGVQETLAAVAMSAGSVAASGLVELLGESGALVVAGSVLPLLGIVLARALRRLGGGRGAHPAVFERLRAVPAFQVLPMAVVESLAVRARSEEYTLGTDIVRQGEAGDTFFVISQGAVQVSEDGQARRVQREGDFFGEIALLHRVPRTATVRALERTRVLALDRVDFLAAVGVHPRTRHVLHQVAGERLDGSDPDPA